jgi:hypothetical protein
VPRLYGADADKVILSFDFARYHTAKSTYHWLNAHKISCITKQEWLANSPEVPQMDFFANGYFKNRLAKRKFCGMAGMLTAA